MDTPAVAGSVITCIGCELHMKGVAANFVWSTVAGSPLISILRGGSARGFFSGGDLVNGNVAGEVIKCGGNAISAWTLSENDFALAPGTVENCFCSRL